MDSKLHTNSPLGNQQELQQNVAFHGQNGLLMLQSTLVLWTRYQSGNLGSNLAGA